MKVVVILENGTIQKVLTDDPNIQVLALDSDTDGCDESTEMRMGDESYGLDAMAQALPKVQPKTVERYFERVKKALEKRPKDGYTAQLLKALFGDKKTGTA